MDFIKSGGQLMPSVANSTSQFQVSLYWRHEYGGRAEELYSQGTKNVV